MDTTVDSTLTSSSDIYNPKIELIQWQHTASALPWLIISQSAIPRDCPTSRPNTTDSSPSTLDVDSISPYQCEDLEGKWEKTPKTASDMSDPFELRLFFSNRLRALNPCEDNSDEVVQFALRHRELAEDLHSCILEQLEAVGSCYLPLDRS
jgi:hypothetical protein